MEFQATFKPAVIPFQQFLWLEPFTEERVSVPEDRLALISSRAKVEGMHCLLTTGRMPSCSVLVLFCSGLHGCFQGYFTLLTVQNTCVRVYFTIGLMWQPSGYAVSIMAR